MTVTIAGNWRSRRRCPGSSVLTCNAPVRITNQRDGITFYKCDQYSTNAADAVTRMRSAERLVDRSQHLLDRIPQRFLTMKEPRSEEHARLRARLKVLEAEHRALQERSGEISQQERRARQQEHRARLRELIADMHAYVEGLRRNE